LTQSYGRKQRPLGIYKLLVDRKKKLAYTARHTWWNKTRPHIRERNPTTPPPSFPLRRRGRRRRLGRAGRPLALSRRAADRRLALALAVPLGPSVATLLGNLCCLTPFSRV
jgi:hypothetical protein